jgi:scyllo-inositol 2-dehydrogenase (NAD+)
MPKIKLGVIGLGRMGQVYAEHIARQIPDAALVAVADPRPEVTQPFAAQVGDLTVYADFRDLLSHPALDAVIVATPTNTHTEVVTLAAQAGKHIFCEKPMALTLTETDSMIAIIEKARVLCQVGFMRRFDEGCLAAKRQIEEGVIGQPVTIRSIGRDPFRTSLEYANPAISGGLIVDMGIHDFDLLRWLMVDEVERVYTEVGSLVYPELMSVGDVDNAMIVLRFQHGGLGNVEVSRTAAYGYDIQCEIVGTKGALQVGYLRQTPLLTLTKAGVLHDVVPHFPQRFGAAYTRQIEHFVEAVRDQNPPAVTPTDSRAALQIGLAATRSQHEQRTVYIREVQQ